MQTWSGTPRWLPPCFAWRPAPRDHSSRLRRRTKLWAKPGVNEQGVRSAMLACGFVDSAYIDNTVMTTNDHARAQLCMLDKAFVYQGRRILCADSPDLPACANLPRGKTFGSDPDFDPALLDQRPPRPPAYTYWSLPRHRYRRRQARDARMRLHHGGRPDQHHAAERHRRGPAVYDRQAVQICAPGQRLAMQELACAARLQPSHD
ncbi:hypothetical protein ACTMU2_06000 [Cupriavidus basilensis]